MIYCHNEFKTLVIWAFLKSPKRVVEVKFDRPVWLVQQREQIS